MKLGIIIASAASFLLAGCQKSNLTVLIGAETVVESRSHPIPDSIVVVDGSHFRAVGRRSDVPVPQDSERVDLTGKYVTPVKGGRISPGEAASLDVREGSASGPVVRHMEAGAWR